MEFKVDPGRVLFRRDEKIYGHFLEHFHRQIYGGVFDPTSPLSDEDGFRTDVLEALRKIRVPIIRWPGGCFVSSYHWEDGVGKERTPDFNKAWRVEDPNTFGTDEFVKLCRKLGCEPYICTNAGSGSAEEMSNWLEYCNLPNEGKYARRRIENGFPEPHNVKYWSIGNENYARHEIGAKASWEWGRLVEEAAKMMGRVDPDVELSAAALTTDWNVELLRAAGDRLQWISVHQYWDGIHQTNALASYDRCMSYTVDLEREIRQVRGLLMAYGLEKNIKIAFDEWNLRGWYHPDIRAVGRLPKDPAEYLPRRDANDINSSYTMADAVFTACFLNTLLRNADIVGMANFAPVVNTRGAIFTYPEGIVLRTTYHVFDMYVNGMGDELVDTVAEDVPLLDTHDGLNGPVSVAGIDAVATRDSATGGLRISLINKHPDKEQTVTVRAPGYTGFALRSLSGDSTEDYNDIGRDSVKPYDNTAAVRKDGEAFVITLPPHSVNILSLDR